MYTSASVVVVEKGLNVLLYKESDCHKFVVDLSSGESAFSSLRKVDELHRFAAMQLVRKATQNKLWVGLRLDFDLNEVGEFVPAYS